MLIALVNLDVLAHLQTTLDDYLGGLVDGVVVNRNLVLNGVVLDVVLHLLLEEYLVAVDKLVYTLIVAVGLTLVVVGT